MEKHLTFLQFVVLEEIIDGRELGIGEEIIRALSQIPIKVEMEVILFLELKRQKYNFDFDRILVQTLGNMDY